MAYVSLERNSEGEYLQTSGGRNLKRRRCSPVKQSSAKFIKFSENSSSFRKMPLKLTSELTAPNCNEKVKKCHQSCSDGNDSTNHSPPAATLSNSQMNFVDPGWKEKPLLNYEQVLLMCQNVLKEKESEIRNEYDRILNAKLAEQHEKFVKFVYNKIQKQYGSRIPSYLS